MARSASSSSRTTPPPSCVAAAKVAVDAVGEVGAEAAAVDTLPTNAPGCAQPSQPAAQLPRPRRVCPPKGAPLPPPPPCSAWRCATMASAASRSPAVRSSSGAHTLARLRASTVSAVSSRWTHTHSRRIQRVAHLSSVGPEPHLTRNGRHAKPQAIASAYAPSSSRTLSRPSSHSSLTVPRRAASAKKTSAAEMTRCALSSGRRDASRPLESRIEPWAERTATQASMAMAAALPARTTRTAPWVSDSGGPRIASVHSASAASISSMKQARAAAMMAAGAKSSSEASRHEQPR